MANRHRRFQERLADLDHRWQSAPPETRPSIERTMGLIIDMEEAVLRAQERAEIADLRLAHAEEIIRRIDEWGWIYPLRDLLIRMENHIDWLNRLAQLAAAAPLRDREQIERIIRSAKEADDTARQTTEIVRRMIDGQDSQSA
jgi:hypothetical protein